MVQKTTATEISNKAAKYGSVIAAKEENETLCQGLGERLSPSAEGDEPSTRQSP